MMKEKILKKVYRQDRQKLLISPRPEYNKIFGLDSIELKYFDRAIAELESDGIVSTLAFEISLTDKGVMKARVLK